jgi:hypothetical protein
LQRNKTKEVPILWWKNELSLDCLESHHLTSKRSGNLLRHVSECSRNVGGFYHAMNLGSMNKIRPYFSITDFAQLNQTSVACAIGPSITSSSTDFPFQNLVLGNSFEFSAAEKHKICCLHGANMRLFHIMCIVGSNDISNFCHWLLKLIVQWSSLWGLRASPAVLGAWKTSKYAGLGQHNRFWLRIFAVVAMAGERRNSALHLHKRVY